jgi:hypothetical protein
MSFKAGKPARRKQAYIHTRPRPEHGLDVALADELTKIFAWIPPLAAHFANGQGYLGVRN